MGYKTSDAPYHITDNRRTEPRAKVKDTNLMNSNVNDPVAG